MAWRARWPDQGTWESEVLISIWGLAPPWAMHDLRQAFAGSWAAAPESAAAARGLSPWRTVRHGDGRAPGSASRASPSARRSPRLELYSACSSSSTTVRRFSNIWALRGWASSSDNCSGVVSSMSGGLKRWRWRRAAEVSPVRVSTVTGQVHLADGRIQIARHVHRQRLQRRDIERVQAALAGSSWACRPDRSAWAESRPGSCRRRSAPPAARFRLSAHAPPKPADGRAAASRGTRTSP